MSKKFLTDRDDYYARFHVADKKIYTHEIEPALRQSGMTKASHTGMTINHARFSRINSGQAIPTFGTGQVMTCEKQIINR